MAIDFARTVYLPNYNIFARPIIINPIVSQPNAAPYTARGIFNTVPMDDQTEGPVFSDMRTILDILEYEFSVLPMQRDQITIPAHENLPALGSFEIQDSDANGGGETTLTLRRLVESKP